MKNFEISKLKNSEYDYLVIATTYISPISTLDDVQGEFKHLTGKLIFDLTLINGTNSNRYISAIIEDGIVNRSSFTIVKKVDSVVQNNSMNFFSNHAEVVENGTIPKALKVLLTEGELV
jgi:hypothetical protein